MTPRAWWLFALSSGVWGVPYLFPLVAVVLGVVVLDEHLGAMSVAGLLLILGGSWLSTGGRVPLT